MHFSKSSRAYDSIKNKIINKAIKDGIRIDVKILSGFEVEQEAFDEEKRLILFYGRLDIETGCLANHTDGGDGISGRKWTDEQRAHHQIAIKESWDSRSRILKTDEEKRETARLRRQRSYQRRKAKMPKVERQYRTSERERAYYREYRRKKKLEKVSKS